MTAPMTREELMAKALERIAARAPTDNRCRQCGYKFFSDGMERHSENCAYLIASEALRDLGPAQDALWDEIRRIERSARSFSASAREGASRAGALDERASSDTYKAFADQFDRWADDLRSLPSNQGASK